IGNGWQSGITSLVFFIANKPPALENSNTSPFGTCLFKTASIVSCRETFTIAVATALRKLVVLFVMLFMECLFGLKIKQDSCYRKFTGLHSIINRINDFRISISRNLEKTNQHL